MYINIAKFFNHICYKYDIIHKIKLIKFPTAVKLYMRIIKYNLMYYLNESSNSLNHKIGVSLNYICSGLENTRYNLNPSNNGLDHYMLFMVKPYYLKI